jgi:hypothetical protein
VRRDDVRHSLGAGSGRTTAGICFIEKRGARDPTLRRLDARFETEIGYSKRVVLSMATLRVSHDDLGRPLSVPETLL